MQFNVKKCRVVHFGKGNLGFTYSMAGQCLEDVDYEKDLGVVVSKDLKAVLAVSGIILNGKLYARADQQNYQYKNQEVLLNLYKVYKSMVRLHLEYCCVVWSPHYIKDKQMLKKVQHLIYACFLILRICCTKTGSVNLDCGRSKRGETEQILLKFLKW